eukprot:TRINITY_DN48541_c0_g1_i1.p1 TRINITY_DN48541_c0_g1~~TRINITY_DN48541_c0_g1_i1.p1  ORF type:complete len:473 (+),score=118.92 TRINITY_DN48541_c0_g1_i1:18-1436(+)
MRAVRAAVAALALSISVASADPSAVVTMVASHSSQPMFEGMTPVHVGKINSTNLSAAKVVGEEYHAIPVAPSNYMSHPTILNADGSVYGQPRVVAVPHPHPHMPPMAYEVHAPVEKPTVFTSPQTNVGSNLPAPIPSGYGEPNPLTGLSNLPSRTVRRINREISKLVKLIVLADAKGKHSQVLSLNRVLKRVTRNIRKYPALAPLILNARDMVRHAVHTARKTAKKVSSHKQITSAKIPLESTSAIAKDDKVSKKIVKDVKAANKTKELKKLVKEAKKNAKKAVKKEAKAAMAAKKEMKAVKKDAVKEAKKEAKEAKKEAKAAVKAAKKDDAPSADVTALELTVEKLSKRVEVLSKAAVSFKKQLGADKSSIATLQGNVGSLQKGQTALESHVKVINSHIADVYKKYKQLTKKEKRLTLAARRAISTLSGRVKSQSRAVKSVMKSKKHFKKSIVASLAQLEENIQNLQSMAH